MKFAENIYIKDTVENDIPHNIPNIHKSEAIFGFPASLLTRLTSEISINEFLGKITQDFNAQKLTCSIVLRKLPQHKCIRH
jgi:hypothetical protein